MNSKLRSTFAALTKFRGRGGEVEQPTERCGPDLHVLGEPFATALRSMYSGEPQLGTDGARHNLLADTKIPAVEGVFLYELCRRARARHTLEIGCGYGFSTLYLLAALSTEAGASHTAIDPYETSAWSGVGRRKAEEVGMSGAFRLMEDTSAVAIPRLIGSGALFDLIFVDGSHRFDDVMVDFTLSALVCKQGGYIVFDDMWMPSVRKAVSFVRRNRIDFEEVGAPAAEVSAFQRTADDTRDWKHFEDFD